MPENCNKNFLAPSCSPQLTAAKAKTANANRSPQAVPPGIRRDIAQAVSAGRSVVQVAKEYQLAAVTTAELWQRHEHKITRQRMQALMERIERLQSICERWTGEKAA